MAQTIKHRRGSVASVRNITSFGEAEIVIGSGSVDSKVDGPIVYIGKPGGSSAANDYVPISKMYTGGGLPSITPANYGSTLDGLPYYDSTNKKLYILGSHTDGTSGHTEIQINSASIQNFDSVVVSALPAGTISGSTQIVSLLPAGTVSGSDQITDVITDNYISASAAASGFGDGGAAVGGIFVETGSFHATTNDLQITGSTNTALEVSQSIKAFNINAGNPTSNAWQTNLDGSYFNNFDSTTDVSEILRFVAGLLSSSAANPTANSRTFSYLSVGSQNTDTGTAPAGYVPNDNDIDDIQYLIDKGFASVGGTLFPSKTIHTNTGFSVRYSSAAAGSSDVESSNDSQLFGLGPLSSGNPAEFRVSGSHSFTFINNQTDIDNSTATETSSSSVILSNSSFGTSNGLTLAKINTVNPAVIPAAFQDGKFVNVHGQNLVDWTTETLTSVSASGEYELNTTIGIATGSQSDYSTRTASTVYFWAPVSSIDTNIGTNTLASEGETVTALTLTSGSLSGAPYINGGTWKLTATASGVFEPMYAASTTLVDVTIGGTSGYTISNTAGSDTLSTNGGSIQTSGMVTSADGTTARNSGTPSRTDLVKVDATYTISGTGDTFQEVRTLTDTSYTLALKARNRSNSQSTLDTQTVNLHTAGTFGQVAASGSMGYFGGGTASTALDERFTNETYRRTISNSTSLTNAWDSSTVLDLTDGGDLQVKPGYLVDPESANGYWYPTTGYDNSNYKWYLREFETSAANNKGTLTINLDPNSSADLVTFDSTTTNKIAVGVIFEATDSKIFDAVKGNQSYGGSLNSQSNGANNPFSDSVDVVGDFSSFTNSNGTLTLGLNNAGGQTINSSNSKIWLLIRYKGTPGQTLERIQVSVS